jgi:hypothetical protein
MDKAAQKQNQKYLKKVNGFSDTIQKVQSLVNIGMLKFEPEHHRVIVHPYCLSSLATDANRKAYIQNLSLYYIVKYWEVFEADLKAIVAPKTPEYKFTVVEQVSLKPLAKYISENVVELL